MVKIACVDATCSHTGSVCSGSVTGTLNGGSNNFVSIKHVNIMVEDGTMEVPAHNNPPCFPENIQSHSFTIDTFNQSFVFINGKRIVVVGDEYSTDTTIIDSAGTNNFVEVL